MGRLGSIVGKVRKGVGSLFRGGKPKPPKIDRTYSLTGTGPWGHRGIASGNAAEPDLSAENISKWKPLTEDQTLGFLYDNQPLFVHSTNVAMMQYDREAEKLMVEFKDGSAYLYDAVTPTEAEHFVRYMSKGQAVWDLLRVRGTKHGHKKNFVKIRDGHR